METVIIGTIGLLIAYAGFTTYRIASLIHKENLRKQARKRIADLLMAAETIEQTASAIEAAADSIAYTLGDIATAEDIAIVNKAISSIEDSIGRTRKLFNAKLGDAYKNTPLTLPNNKQQNNQQQNNQQQKQN